MATAAVVRGAVEGVVARENINAHSDVSPVKPVTWRGRCARVLRVTPGILALITSIVAIVCALVWKSPYLCIPFGVGAICSGYLVYLGHSHGKALAKQKTLDDIVQSNAKAIARYSAQNERLETNVGSLNGEVDAFKTENRELKGQVDRFKQQNDKMQQDSTVLLQSLEGVASKLTEGHVQFGTQLGVFVQKCQTVQQSGHVLARLVPQFSTILQTFQQIMSGDALKREIENLSKLRVESAEILQGQRLANVETAKKQGELREITRTYDEMATKYKNLNDKHAGLLERMETLIQRVESGKTLGASDVKELKEELTQLRTGVNHVVVAQIPPERDGSVRG